MRLGQRTSIQLTGPSRRAFQKAEATLADRIHSNGGEASWLAGDTWTAHEQLWEDERQPLIYETTWRDAAWLPSGLLRRLGLLHTVAVPQVVTGHEARLGEWWILELDHDSDTGLRRAELVQALTDPEHGLPLELRGHRDLTPGESLGLVLLKSPDNTATLQLRYDRIDYPIKEERAEMFAAIRRRISALTGEAPLPHDARLLGHWLSRAARGVRQGPFSRSICRHTTKSDAPRACRTGLGLRLPREGDAAGPGRGRRRGGRG